MSAKLKLNNTTVKPELEAMVNYFYIDSDRGRLRSQEFAFALSPTVQIFVNRASL
jgi:hypothetical protein